MSPTEAGEQVDARARRPDINVGVLVAQAPQTPAEPLLAFAQRLVDDVGEVLEGATDADWRFHVESPTRLSADEPHRPSDFLDEASLRMAEGPFDAVIVVTDVALYSRRRRTVAGLASPIARIAVVSTRKLRLSPRGEPDRPLESEAVRWNAGALALHLIGHMLGLGHGSGEDTIAAPFAFDPERRSLPEFGPANAARARRAARRLPERELHGRRWPAVVGFHFDSAARNLGQVLRTVARNRAPLLPLALPSLATAAVTPTFILVFTAEIWDVGLNMPGATTWAFAAASVLAATAYLLGVQQLFFPRKERRIVTEHMAVVNVSILLTVLLAMVGLFLMVAVLMLVIELVVFPAGLVRTWPTLEDPVVDFGDWFRISGFISAIGVITGALAGGLESRTVIRHLALFLDEA